jgi:hypothetical protein
MVFIALFEVNVLKMSNNVYHLIIKKKRTLLQINTVQIKSL